MNTDNATTEKKPKASAFERIGDSLYRRGGVIFARVRVNGRRTYRSTGTSEPKEARAWLRKWKHESFLLKAGLEPEGVTLHRERVTVGELLDAYDKAGCPTRKMQQKATYTVRGERYAMNPVRAYFRDMPAAALTLADCDKYFDWRNSGSYQTEYKLRGHTKTKRTRGGKRAVDLELTVLGNAMNLAVRRNVLKANPLTGRGRYTSASEVRHCREVAPTPAGLQRIEHWLRARGENAVADLVCFLAYSGLRIGEAMPLSWEDVAWGEKILHVKREKRGIMPWVPILPEMEALLRAMKTRAVGYLLFPSPFDANRPREISALRQRITSACKTLDIGHVTPHGLRSYFVTQCRQSGLTDAEIAMLIGDKTGPALIAQVYGDLRPDHLLAQAQRIRLTASAGAGHDSGADKPKSIPTLPDAKADSLGFTVASGVAEAVSN
jgi:integrase